MVSTPRSVRFEESTERRLNSFASRHPGLAMSGAAALLVEEGLRMDAHPGVVFREGPAGRRAGLAGGPDVWEVVRAIKLTRQAEPALSADEIVLLVSENTGVSRKLLQLAVSYYAEFPEDIDDLVAEADRAEAEAERMLKQRHDLLGV